MHPRSLILTTDVRAPGVVSLRKVLGDAHHIDPRQSSDLLRQQILLFSRQFRIYIKIDNRILFESKILVKHKMYLVVDNHRPDDEQERYRKLKDDQCLSNIVVSAS